MISLKRWRNTRGFGVHSPFGYELATRVVRPGKEYSYYGYHTVDAACEKEGCSRNVRRQARMLLRLASFLKVDSAFLPTGVHPAFHSALIAANAAIRLERKAKNASSCSFIGTHGTFLPLDTLRELIKTPGRTVALINAPEGWPESLFETMEQGILIKGKQNAFLIAREGMQKVAYEMDI